MKTILISITAAWSIAALPLAAQHGHGGGGGGGVGMHGAPPVFAAPARSPESHGSSMKTAPATGMSSRASTNTAATRITTG